MIEVSDQLVTAISDLIARVHERAVSMRITDSYVVVSRQMMPKMTWYTCSGKVEFVQSRLAPEDEVYVILRQDYHPKVRSEYRKFRHVS